MPTTLKITKNNILDAAFNIVRESGIESVSNREIAKKLNSSIRPIYYQFKNVDELKAELYSKMEKYFYDYIIENIIDDVLKYKQIGINYIKFARDEKNLFKVLFMSEFDYAPKKFISKEENDFNRVMKFAKNSTRLSDNKIEDFHVKMWLFTHGIATLVATKTIKFTDDEIKQLLSQEFQALMLLEQNPNNPWVIRKGD